MRHVVCPFVGFYPDFKHPFAVATSHSTAFADLMNDCRSMAITKKDLPQWFGFVIKSDDGFIRYANRMEAFQVAQTAGQLKDSYTGNALESYMLINYDREELNELYRLAEKVIVAFKGLTSDSVVEI